MRLLVLILITAVVGCANSPQDECGGKVLILWPTAAGDFKFQKIQLSTLKSPYELKGSAAEIYYESRITSQGFEGPVARPNLTRSGDVCVPMDTASSISLAAYAHMERLYLFDQKLNVDQQLSWPRKVGVDIRLRSSDGISHSNAHYFGVNDSMAVVPYSKDGLPLGLNAGVLAHEHFHAHFQSQVNRPINQTIATNVSLEEFFYAGFGVKPGVEELEATPQNPESLNKFVIRSWNEGLADYYGSVFSGQQDFFSMSLSEISPYRTLEGPLELFKSGEDLIQEVRRLDRWNQKPCRRSLMCTTYSQGTVLARLMYRIGKSGSIAQEDLLKLVLTRMKRASELTSPIFSRQVIAFEEIVTPILEGVKLNADACSAIKATLSKTTILRSFSQCNL